MAIGVGFIDRLAKEAGYNISERMSFESHDSCAQRFVMLVAEECAKLCEGVDQADRTPAPGACAQAIRREFKMPFGAHGDSRW